MNANFQYPKGAEWRKWDLHVHTPFSLVQHFSATESEDIWETFIKDLENLPTEFKVLGINDYLFIEGYKKVLEYRAAGRLQNIETIFPVVEFRIKKFAGHRDFKRVNFHVIFSDALSPQIIESQFLNGLSGKYHLTPGLDGIQWNGLITKESLIDLGAAIKRSVPEAQLVNYGSDLEEGFNNLNLEEKDILTLLNENTYLKGKTLTAIGKTEWESLSWNDQSIAEKKDVINKADLVFISSETPEAAHNAKRKLTEQGVNNLLLDCSDAHYNSTAANQKDRIGKCFTWIKGDPTFEGLKQIIFEPETRVLLQDEIPPAKTDYNVISSVRFIGDTGADFFPDESIHLNTNLNVIIGGKSSGKSLLLYHIAKTVDPGQVAEKLGIVGEKEFDLKARVTGFDFEVTWKDGAINKLSDPADSKLRQITYIPQMYINHLAEQKGEKNLADLIESILLQNDEFRELKETYDKKIQQVNLEIANNINEIFIVKENYQSNLRELKAIGDRSAIEGNIAHINKEISELKAKAGFTPDEDARYAKLKKQQSSVTRSKAKIDQYNVRTIDYITALHTLKETTKESMAAIPEDWDDFQDNNAALSFIEANLSADNVLVEQFFDRLINKYQAFANVFEGLSRARQQTLEELEEATKEFTTKIANQTLLASLNERLLSEQNKIRQIEEKQKQLNKITEEGAALKSAILTGTNTLLRHYQLILNKIQSPELSQIGNGLILNASLTIDVPSFQNGFLGTLDGRSNFNNLFGSCFDTDNNYVFNENDHIANIATIYDKVWQPDKNGIKFRSGFGSKEAITQLLKDTYKFRYNIIYNNDDILQMSPGKRGLVLMQLILHLSNAQHPILIDQPEDNLDNRTIFNELNEFIKTKKFQRQIILVTHNANLVVSTDSELVIVANQNGQDKGKTNEKFQFEYVSGSLEHTFKSPGNPGILQQMGIREHVCDILEGGEQAFIYRERKYGFKN
ncbi:TrlF family AAA-like ATPase [Mucilaginibacter sp. E4BP6]|uniref:TrlF family AAA-like ATPase n=1 Tax=Mucilaginibacter sp. E4BP6 TaxID=2723089 RepID=UPI0015CBDBCC|nr:hypothetical protein [Mucilaginibacter sp. E4BP6]NYE66905.1 ABC-type dipeptide/oligopeptide/nickel transport system ATPase component [Mucilaginibacter sp. E4BP6]